MKSTDQKPQAARPATPDSKLHPRNRHRSCYDFARLIAIEPALGDFIETKVHGDDSDQSIDFANSATVKALNCALLKDSYGIDSWDIATAEPVSAGSRSRRSTCPRTPH